MRKLTGEKWYVVQTLGGRERKDAEKVRIDIAGEDDEVFIIENEKEFRINGEGMPASDGEYIMDALKHGKHVLCDKPMVLSKEQALEAYVYAEDKGLVLMEGIKTAYCLGYKKVLEIAGSGAIGNIRYIDACFTKLENPNNRELTDRKYGGSFTELGSYVALPVPDLLGTEYKDISFESLYNDIGIDIFTKAHISYEDKIADLTCGLGVKSEGRLLIGGTKGYIRVDAPWWKTRHIEAHYEDESKTVTYEEPFEGDGLRYEISCFTDMAREDNNSMNTRQRSIVMAEIMEKFLEQRTA